MMRLRKNVMLVRGEQNGGVYDFNLHRFYRVPLAAIDFLSAEIADVSSDCADEETMEFVSTCRKLELIEDAEGPLIENTRIESCMSKKIEPRFCWLEINSSCNQHCRHCFLGEELNTGSMDVALIRKVVGDLDSIGVTTVAITGGEPSLHSDFRLIVEMLRAARMKVVLLTNGTLLSDDAIDFLIQNEVLVKIPLFGSCSCHDRMTGLNGSFRAATEVIRRIARKGGKVVVSSTVTAENVGAMDFVCEFCRSLHVPFEPAPVYPIGIARRNWDALSSNYDEILKVCGEYNGGEPTPNLGGKEIYQPLDVNLTPYSICGTENFAISNRGLVLPCLLLRSADFVMGHASELKKIFTRTGGRLEQVQSLLNYNNDVKCSRCEARYMCKGGGCRAVSYLFKRQCGMRNEFYSDCYYAERPRSSAGPNRCM